MFRVPNVQRMLRCHNFFLAFCVRILTFRAKFGVSGAWDSNLRVSELLGLVFCDCWDEGFDALVLCLWGFAARVAVLSALGLRRFASQQGQRDCNFPIADV